MELLIRAYATALGAVVIFVSIIGPLAISAGTNSEWPHLLFLLTPAVFAAGFYLVCRGVE